MLKVKEKFEMMKYKKLNTLAKPKKQSVGVGLDNANIEK